MFTCPCSMFSTYSVHLVIPGESKGRSWTNNFWVCLLVPPFGEAPLGCSAEDKKGLLQAWVWLRLWEPIGYLWSSPPLPDQDLSLDLLHSALFHLTAWLWPRSGSVVDCFSVQNVTNHVRNSPAKANPSSWMNDSHYTCTWDKPATFLPLRDGAKHSPSPSNRRRLFACRKLRRPTAKRQHLWRWRAPFYDGYYCFIATCFPDF